MGKYFGTDGFRGEAGKGLTADHAYKIGRFLGHYLNGRKQGERAKVVLGKDTRLSCYMLECALIAGLTASGADAYAMHVTTTPSVAYIAKVDGFDCGIMISASHNPYSDNGIKLINGRGEKMDEGTVSLVEDCLDSGLSAQRELPLAVREKIGRVIGYSCGRDRYAEYLASTVPCRFCGVKVGLDCANGSTWSMAKAVFESLGAETHVLNATPNGLNINENCGSIHIDGLQKFVVEKGLDVGFAFDGDGDRCLCVDEKGKILTGDHILYICARYLKERGELIPNTVVTTVMSNLGLYKAFDKLGIGYAATAVGDKFVYEYMAANGNCLGGEQSGHIIFSRYASTGDGILTALRVMQVMQNKGRTPAELAAPLKLCPQVLKNVGVTDKDEVMADRAVLSAIKAAEAELKGKGRILVRKSGTEPLIRVMAEAENANLCESCVKSIVAAIEAANRNKD